MATLAICKPKIRLAAHVGDLVVAFTGSKLSAEPHAVCWAGIVSEKLTFAEYWDDERFATKKPGRSETPDNIYRSRGGRIEQEPNSSHTLRHADRDIGGGYVLAFDPCWYFGAVGPVLPASFGLRMIRGRRGHGRVDLTEVGWKTLRDGLKTSRHANRVLMPNWLRQLAENCSTLTRYLRRGLLGRCGLFAKIRVGKTHSFSYGSKCAMRPTCWRR